jgi:carnitine O-acetyltransferase
MSTVHLSGRPRDWKAAAPEAPVGTTTFAAQKRLPRLPVPELHKTLSRLKETLKPLAWSDQEYNAVEQKIHQFASGEGPVLQNRLLEHYQGAPHWLEQWWDDGAYLGYRDSVIF